MFLTKKTQTEEELLSTCSCIQGRKRINNQKGRIKKCSNNYNFNLIIILYFFIITTTITQKNNHKGRIITFTVVVEGFTAKLIPTHYANHQVVKKNKYTNKSHDNNTEKTRTTAANQKTHKRHSNDDNIESPSNEEDNDNKIHNAIKNDDDDQEIVVVVDGLPFITTKGPPSSSSSSSFNSKNMNNNDTTNNTNNNKITILSSLSTLIKLSRPKNFPVSILLHCLSIHLVLSNLLSKQQSSYNVSMFLSALIHPSLLLTICCILLLSATSMIINDYYDARNGVDSLSNHYHPLSSSGDNASIPLPIVKRFLSYLYTALLLGIVALPGIYTRISVIIGTMLTYWYTEYLKPKTWIKNIICAGLIGISPLASGLATMHIYSTTTTISTSITPLLRMVFILCIGVLSREITMDIVDYHGDKLSNIQTIPVKYGKRFATTICMILSSINYFLIIIPSLLRLVSTTIKINSATATTSFTCCARIIQFFMATIGASILLYDAYRVKVSEGLDDHVSNNAINHSSVSILLILASFI